MSEKQSRFVYEAARVLNEATGAPINPEAWEDRSQAFREQMTVAVEKQCGPNRSNSPEKLHDEWVKAYFDLGWEYGPERDVEKKRHPDMVDYSELGKLEQEKDAQYMALCDIARKWID